MAANSETILTANTHPGDSTLETVLGTKFKGDGYYGRGQNGWGRRPIGKLEFNRDGNRRGKFGDDHYYAGPNSHDEGVVEHDFRGRTRYAPPPRGGITWE